MVPFDAHEDIRLHAAAAGRTVEATLILSYMLRWLAAEIVTIHQ